jgi:hypothetical protein
MDDPEGCFTGGLGAGPEATSPCDPPVPGAEGRLSRAVLDRPRSAGLEGFGGMRWEVERPRSGVLGGLVAERKDVGAGETGDVIDLEPAGDFKGVGGAARGFWRPLSSGNGLGALYGESKVPILSHTSPCPS